MPTAFDPFDLGGLRLTNRIVMSPMTRSRAVDRIPTPLMAEYYAQRASAGLIITEGTQPSVVGQGYLDTPGLHDDRQVAGWRRVTDAVHAKGGKIFVQLMHTGRVGHSGFLPDGMTHVAPSAISADVKIFTGQGMQASADPVELDEDGIQATIADFARSARLAMEAGFDGVELHGANGYLLHQFLATNTNQRGDHWGGDAAARIRFPLAVVRAVAGEIGAERLGLRISPGVPNNDIAEHNAHDTYEALITELDPLGLAYLHIFEGPHRDLTLRLRRMWHGALMLNPYTPEGITGPEHLRLIEDGTADLVSFAALFLANPDLPARLAAGGPYNTPDPATYYGGDQRGYTDYPALA
ncbi:alkene reductase [Sphaerisporangium melleum]|uniref:Alkene reductase n=1 Tax=Sphaerisporangium melleum TaxID=321316 RepID=A0A917RJ20_9ACTN|nr:alkene reductase [Sphaerisporangium melleum]GGL10129.1 alkene reductase [Sphaerisporangium melleum]GII70775.1 alkene reductase [Sphaerisporangium melleum]